MAVIGLVLIAVGNMPAPSRPDGPSGASGSSERPSAGTPAPGRSDDDLGWTALDLPPYQPVARLSVDGAAGGRIDRGAAFTLRSLTDTPAAELAAHITVDPVAELSIEAGASPDLAIVRPTSPLMENGVYRFRLTDPNGALLEEWTYRIAGPLHVVRSIPEAQATQVPTDTGIELEFDQDGVTDISDHFSVEPDVAGAFERHGRTWVFVPSAGLEPATLYTVTLGAGLRVEGTSEALEHDVVVAFETRATKAGANPPQVVFGRPLAEIRPGEPSVVPVDVHGDFGDTERLERAVTLFSLDGAPAAVEAAATLAIDRSWAARSVNGGIDTDGLREVASFDAPVHTPYGQQRLEIPVPLDPGFYLLHVAQDGRPAQVVLQVSDAAAYVVTSDTALVTWVNDLATQAPVAAASVTVAGGAELGRTDASGLLRAALTEPGLGTGAADGAAPFVLVTTPGGDEVIAAIRDDQGWFMGRQASSDRWWLLMGTDRLQYRQNDTIQVWGLARSRADRSVPGDVELRLTAGWDGSAPPIARAPVEPTARGTLVGELPVEDLPPGSYQVSMVLDEESVASAWVTVTDIRKPLFSIELETDRLAYIAGDTVAADVSASFFDQTSAPGLALRVSGTGVSPEADRPVKLGARGTARVTFDAVTSGPYQETGGVYASVATAEEGSSYADAAFAIFPSSAWLEGEASVSGGSLTVRGRLTRVDLAAAEAQQAVDGWVTDPSGDPIAGRTISATVERVTWVATQSGTSYDFLEKRAVPTFTYERNVERIGIYTPISAADGSFELSLPFDASDADAEITLHVTDEEGRAVQLSLWASDAPPQPMNATDFPYLEQQASCGGRGFITADLGEPFEVLMRSGAGTPSVDGRTLFLVSRAGIDDVIVTTEAGIGRVFDEGDLPSLSVRAVRLTPTGYIVTSEVVVQVANDEKVIDLVVEPDRARYAPGDDVTVTISATGPDGRPIASDVVVQAVDAKLYAIHAAERVSVEQLMAPTASGFSGAYATHQVPAPAWEPGCGATTGGGEPRGDFKDNATFQLVRTGTDGLGQATFEAPDDLTSWVVTATAFSDHLDAGTTAIDVPVGLPFFVDAVIASEYLAGEEPIIQLRAYGDALAAGDAVTFSVDSPSLGLDGTQVAGQAFEPARLELPALALGDHELTISVDGPGDLRDAIARTVRVVPTRLRTLQHAYDTVSDTFDAPGGDGMTTYVVTDAGRGAVVPTLQHLTSSDSARLDAMLAAELARRVLVEDFGLPETSVPPSGYAGMAGNVGEGGLSLLPYASGELVLTARTALVAPEEVPHDIVVPVLTDVLAGDPTRERAIVALAGLAGLGRDVHAELLAFDPAELTLRERLWLALGLAANGDADAARALERDILLEHGQRLDGWIRLDAGSDASESAEATASMLLLAAELRDPIALDVSRYLLDNPSSEHLGALEQIGFARAAVAWLPREAAHFTWSVDGARTEVTLDPGEALTLTLTAPQRESLALEPIDGELFVASSWLGGARVEDLPNDPSVSIERTVSPGDHAPADDLVRVRLTVRFADPPEDACYQVTDLVPSGLAPVVEAHFTPRDSAVISPYEVEGQRVSWCIATERTSVMLGYSARIVSAGTYRWEPAVVQAVDAPTIGSATPVIAYTVD